MRMGIKLPAAALGTLLGVLAAFEGRSLIAYVDPVGIPTICEGWTHGVQIGDTATPEKCDELTFNGVQQADQIISQWLPGFPDAPLMRAAYVSFIYNVGPGGAEVKDGFVWLKSGDHSTMFRLLKAGEYYLACDELTKWTRAGGRQLAGLVRRRAAEQELCHAGLRDYIKHRFDDRLDDKRLASRRPDSRAAV